MACGNEQRLSLRQRLFADNKALHDRVDRAMVDGATRDGRIDIGRLLDLHAAVLPGLVDSLRQAGADRLYPHWQGFEDQLRKLQEARQSLPRHDRPAVAPPPVGSLSDMLGMLYAVEGSTEGNRIMLARLRRQEGADPVAGSAFLNHGETGCFQHFITWMNNQQGIVVQDAVRSAQAVYHCYLQAAES